MGKGPRNGGEVANRGFIFQAVIALMECMKRDDWTDIKMEPETDDDKVDIMLYKNEVALRAIQVKSSINPFKRSDAKKWLESLKEDAEGAKGVLLCLVGDSFNPSCEKYIAENSAEIIKVPFENLKKLCAGSLIEYIKNAGVGGDVRVDDLEFIDDSLFAKIIMNCIVRTPVSKSAFEERFQKSLPVHIIPKCLTLIPTIDHVVGLIGRDDVKAAIREMLAKNDCIALVSGLGGIGKTTVMQHICNDVKNEGYYVAWIECGDSLRDDLLILRNALGIPRNDNTEQAYEKIVDTIRSRLNEKLYLFLDNLSRRLNEDERKLLNSLGVHSMITSRFEHDYFNNVKLDILSKEAVIDMFYGYYRSDRERKYKEIAWGIIESVNSHTLLVELIAKAAWKKGGTLEAFQKELKAAGVFVVFEGRVRTEHDEENLTIAESIKKLYTLSSLSTSQQHIMKLFTIFTPEQEIYYKLCEWAGFNIDDMDELVERGWLERGGLENGYYIHQIVKESLSKQVGKVRLEDYGTLLDKAINMESYLSVMETFEVIRERIVLTTDIVSHLWKEYQADDKIDRDRATVVGVFHNRLANVYKNQGNYDQALRYYRQALDINEQVLGEDHPNTLTTYNNTAIVYSSQGEYDMALALFGKTLAVREKVLGTDHSETGVIYHNMATVYYAQGNFEKALIFYRKALVSNLRAYGTDDPKIATMYSNIALSYSALGNYEKALTYYLQALDIQKRVLGSIHPSIATTYNNIAEIYYAQRNFEKVLEFYRKDLNICERILGTNHPDTAVTYNNIGIVYRDMGNYDKSLEYFEKAIFVREMLLGTKHPTTAWTYYNIAILYECQNNYKNAHEFYQKAFDVYLATFGDDHHRTKTIRRRLTNLQEKMNK